MIKTDRVSTYDQQITDTVTVYRSGTHDVNLVLLPGLLEPFIKYIIRAIGYVEDARTFTEIELSVNLPPYGGDCGIDPQEGEFLEAR